MNQSALDGSRSPSEFEAKVLYALARAGERGLRAYELAHAAAPRRYGWTPQMAAAWVGRATARLRQEGAIVRERTNGVNYCYYARQGWAQR